MSVATGNISHLGKVSITESHQTKVLASTNYRTSIVTGGQAIITAANGDRLFLKFGGSGVATPFGFNDAFVYIITGGTGRFAQQAQRWRRHSFR